MRFHDLRSFLSVLESKGQLVRIISEVDPFLEAPEIAARVVREDGPALLFMNPKGSSFPLLMNLFGSMNRIRLALGKEPAEFGEEMVHFAHSAMESGIWGPIQNWKTGLRFLNARAKEVNGGPVLEVTEEPDLGKMPVTTSWPKDGGRFFTFPLVITCAPGTKRHNVGIYRMQVFDRQTTGMHWQIEKGGRFHYSASEKKHGKLSVAVAIGADPALLLSAVLPLPEGVDEMAFAGFLRGSPTRVLGGALRIPANAEMILEGEVDPEYRRAEGPFGDHYGHYSKQADFPVFRIKQVRRRRDAIFHATVVGKPPMEDWHLGVMTLDIMKPLLRFMHPEIIDIWAYPEAGFHNLQVLSVDERYGREGLKSAFFLMGSGQASLAKFVVVVDPSVDVRRFDQVIAALGRNFDPREDFFLFSPTSTDTLDFACSGFEKGSKALFFATRRKISKPLPTPTPADIRARFHDVADCTIIAETLLVFKPRGEARSTIEAMLPAAELGSIKFVAAVSDDIDLRDSMSIVWGLFTRFDPGKDMMAESVEVQGIKLRLQGRLGIDATLKGEYPQPLEMEPEIKKRVDSRWREYFPK
ncbi:MAG: UbiD family decarboxylase [Candidatus Riflebacteria bacterium]|nr:UbiD family decarboxylase [Candidatus Riflebacteria bacterium]